MSLVCGLESGPQPSAFHEGTQACAEAVSSLNTLSPPIPYFSYVVWIFRRVMTNYCQIYVKTQDTGYIPSSNSFSIGEIY